MKTILTLLLATVTIATSFAQQPKKYIFVDHFTNTRCGICSSFNPGLFTRLDNNPGEVHHISIHSEVPYNSCVFYQANTTGNNARKNYYTGIIGTPRTYTNGTILASGSNILPQSRIDALKGATSPLRVAVTETQSGGVNNVNITVKSYGAVASQNLKLYAAVVERRVQYNAPNGETEHYNVFRTMLPSDAGETFTPAAIGSEVSFNYSVNIDAAWVDSEVYTVVWIQDATTDTIVNSGTKYDILLDPIVTDETCAAAGNGSIDLNVSGGTPPFTYIWSNGGTNEIETGLGAGSYTITVTDAASFEYITTIDVGVTNNIQTTMTYTASTGNDGTATVVANGGTPPYTYNWSSGSSMQTATNLPLGVVNVTVTDDNGCTKTDSVDVKAIFVSGTINGVVCSGERNGSIYTTTSGGVQPYTYAWSNGSVTDFIDSLAAGSYTVTVTDNANNVVEVTFSVSEPSQIVIQETIVDENNNDADGSITLTVTGGTQPYSYDWSNSAVTNSITNLTADTYTVVITDNNGCDTVKTYVIGKITGIEGISAFDNLSVYPNPFSSELVIKLPNNAVAEVALFNLLGEQIITEQVVNETKLNTGSLNSGLYILRVQIDGQVYTDKFLKE